MTGAEGNHGEDVKEYYFYLDTRLVEENRRRRRQDPEFELLETGVFGESRYFDVTVEYAKAATDDNLIRITATNRGSEPAPLHLLPTLWFRNSWSWDVGAPRPRPRRAADSSGPAVIAEHPAMDGISSRGDALRAAAASAVPSAMAIWPSRPSPPSNPP